jgi:hypothetical protein
MSFCRRFQDFLLTMDAECGHFSCLNALGSNIVCITDLHTCQEVKGRESLYAEP